MNEYNPEHEPSIQHPVLIQLNTEVANLKSQNQALQDTITRVRDKSRTKERELEAKLKELLDDENIEYEYAKEIADIFDISLTKMVEVEYTISATANVEVPYNTDADSVADNVFVERVEFYSHDSDYDVLESDFDVDNYNVRH